MKAKWGTDCCPLSIILTLTQTLTLTLIIMLKANSTVDRRVQLAKVFASFDMDLSGGVDPAELMALGTERKELKQKARVWTAERNAQLMRHMDLSSDGVVTEGEFVEYFLEALGLEEDVSFLEVMTDFMLCVAEAKPTAAASRPKPILTRDSNDQLNEDGVKAWRKGVLSKVFLCYDATNKGFLTPTEVVQMAQARRGHGNVMDKRQQAVLLRRFDTNGDAEVSCAEFTEYFMETWHGGMELMEDEDFQASIDDLLAGKESISKNAVHTLCVNSTMATGQHESLEVNESNMLKWLSCYEKDLNAVLKGEQEMRRELEEVLAWEPEDERDSMDMRSDAMSSMDLLFKAGAAAELIDLESEVTSQNDAFHLVAAHGSLIYMHGLSDPKPSWCRRILLACGTTLLQVCLLWMQLRIRHADDVNEHSHAALTVFEVARLPHPSNVSLSLCLHLRFRRCFCSCHCLCHRLRLRLHLRPCLHLHLSLYLCHAHACALSAS